MRIRILVSLLIMTTLGALGNVDAQNKIPKNLVTFLEKTLVQIAQDPVIISAVRAQNALDRSLEDIKELDKLWRGTEGVSRWMLDLMSNDCALVLHNIEEEYPFIVETFVMDNIGANVAQTCITSDYWQGDEAKFIESYDNGAGGTHYGEIEYDDSANAIVIQVSVPVRVATRAIGAITFSINLDRWERR